MRGRGDRNRNTGDPPDENRNVPSNMPDGGIRWVSNAPTGHTSSDMLYVNLEETFPPSPPLLERDPNMSSAARYSPLHATPTSQPCLTPLQHTPLLHTYQHHTHNISKTIPSIPTNSMCEDNRNVLAVGTYALSPSANANSQSIDDINTSDISQYMNSYSTHIDVNAVNNDLQSEAPILNSIDDVTCSDDVVQHEGNGNYYSQQVYNSDGYEVSSSSEGVYLTTAPPISNADNAVAGGQILDTSNDMLVFSSDGEFHMIDENTMKTEHVELLISGAQTGISYSLSKENGFIIARPTNSSSTKNEALAVDMSVLTALDDYSQFNTQQNIPSEHDNANVNLGIIQSNELDITLKDEPEPLSILNVTNFDDDNESSDGKRRARKIQTSSDISITCIPDKSVPCRAKASLPATHLWLRNNTDNESEVLGVFARRRIPLRARFGPLEGIRKRLPQDTTPILSENCPLFLIHTENGDYTIDISDEKTSNWMRYVRFSPGPYQNLCLQQLEDGLFFTSSKPIPPRSELLLGYGITYARRWNLPFPSQRTPNDDESIEWPCFECPMQFGSSPELQNHLNTHDEVDNSSSVRKIKKKVVKCASNVENHCSICNRTFPRSYSLKRHLRTHEGNVDSSSHLRKSFECTSSDMKDTAKTYEFPNQLNTNSESSNTGDIITSNDENIKAFWSDNTVKSEMMHAEPMEYKCDVCNAAFSNAEKLNLHSVEHKNEAMNVPMSTSSDTNLNLDAQLPSNEEVKSDNLWTASCSLCSKVFNRHTLLTEHVQSQHRHADDSLVCHVCNEKFTDENVAKKHNCDKRNFQKFQCQDCSVYFNTKDKLQLHMLKHSDSNEFTCPNCNKQFKRKDKLKEHVRRQQRVINNNKEIIYLCSERANGSLSSNHDDPTAYLHFTFKCHPCRLGFKRRGMLVNHLARRHPEVSRATVPELQLPILRTARDYFCQHCDKVYKSSSKRKAHILKNHPGESLPPSTRDLGSGESNEIEVLGYSACVGSVPSAPHHCPYTPCHKQYASKAKLSQHIKHKHLIPAESKENTQMDETVAMPNVDVSELKTNDLQTVTGSDQITHFLSNMNYQTVNDDKMTTIQTISEVNNALSPSASKCRKLLPPLQQMSSFNKCNGNKPRDDLLNESTTFTQNTDKILEDNLKISNQFHINDLIKTLSEMKNAKSQDAAALKQNYVLSKSDWKSNDPTTFSGLLRCGSNYLHLIHIMDSVEILDNKDSPSVNTMNRDIGNAVMINDVPKLHISGHILSVESNKLPPVSVLSSNAMSGGSLTTQYTDR
ncbi:uncharacterized protein LOC143915375 isoform X2 [Arctopsyche grandis]|uniref:uncharacterized protein LOC143915375 isoform X2 n=1 Tax=Arctopsyche grandis TaxID=121162 RepID=UPI00406D70AD